MTFSRRNPSAACRGLTRLGWGAAAVCVLAVVVSVVGETGHHVGQVADPSQDPAALDNPQPMSEARRLLWTDTAFNYLEAHEKARARDAKLMVEAMERGEFEALSEVRLRQMLSNHAQAMVYLERLREAMED